MPAEVVGWLIKPKLLHKYFTKAVQFSCPISGVGRVKQFGMCGLNTESELTGDESRRSSWASGDAHIHLFLPRSAVLLRSVHFSSYNLLSFFSFYREVCTAKRAWNIYICISPFLHLRYINMSGFLFRSCAASSTALGDLDTRTFHINNRKIMYRAEIWISYRKHNPIPLLQ